MSQGQGGGRPTKYSKELCDKLPSMFENGESVAEVCAELDIAKDTFYKWCKRYPKFAVAYNKGLEKSEAWWTRLGRFGSTGKVKIQPATWIFNMKNRFKWKDRIENEVTGDGIGGGLVVGVTMSEDDWIAAAKRQQEIMKGGVGEPEGE